MSRIRSLPTTLALIALTGCTPGGPEMVEVPGTTGALKSAANVRAERRAYDGAPPVIGHEDFGVECMSCHEEGLELPGVGYAPVMPHGTTDGMSAISRCEQCHVFRTTDGVFAVNSFAGLPQDLRRGPRLNALAPPVIPHGVFMRENCAACHTGPAAREEIRTSHPERIRCRQCHLEILETGVFIAEGARP